jgi:hypothetical protein
MPPRVTPGAAIERGSMFRTRLFGSHERLRWQHCEPAPGLLSE